MVVYRESPRAHRSPEKQMAQWPPKSPMEALLSSPSGRKKWQDRQSRREMEREVSPSPVRRNILKDMQNAGHGDEEDEDEDDEEEDEETLQLQLQALQTKIKLQKLKAKNKAAEQKETAPSPRKLDFGDRARMPPPPPHIEVPTSPVRSERPPQEQLSPARQRLGFTSNPRAEDISLKRPRDQNPLKRASSTRSAPTAASARDIPRPLSFNERLADTKEKATQKQAKADHLSSIRSTGFSKPSPGGTSIPPESAAEKSRRSRLRAEDITANSRDAQSGARTGHASFSSDDENEDSLNIEHNDSDGYDPFSKIHLKKRHVQHPVVAREMAGKEIYTLPRLLKEVKSPDYDPPDCESDFVVFAILASKSSPLDHATTHKATGGDNPLEPSRNKFMVLKLVDLKWEIDCFLFGTAFTHFWKLTPGTLLAILNPAILPPKGNQHNGRFSLKLGSSEDAVMEIGVARDLALCSAIKKDGQGCGEWVDKRKTEACEFHVSLMVDKARKHRMEVNTMFRDPDGNKDDRTKSRVARGGRGGKKGPGTYSREHGMLYSVPKGVGGRSVANAMDQDDTDALHNLSKEEASRKRIANAQRERDLARSLGEMGNGVGAAYLKATVTSTMETTERTTTRKGGSERDKADAARDELFKKPSARELGLLGNVPGSKRLSPPRERKSHFGLGLATSTSSKATVGWGGAGKSGIAGRREKEIPAEKGQTQLNIPTTATTTRSSLIRPRSTESSLRSNRSSSPVKKRARLQVPDKGIREPGRESLPGQGGKAVVMEDDEDDELEIV